MKYELIAIFCYTCISTGEGEGGGKQGKRIGKLEKGLEVLLQVILHLKSGMSDSQRYY